MKDRKKRVKKAKVPTFNLVLLFTLSVAVLTFVTVFLVILLTRALRWSPLFQVGHVPPHTMYYVFLVLCVIIGTGIAFIVSHIVLRPLQKVINAFDRISEGDFSVRVPVTGILKYTRLGVRFNKMAEELESVEILQNEFIDNFSHEFKTPLASMHGFAALLKKEDLPADQRNEYADIIITEAKRLSELSTTVLLLSKVEKQAILTNVEDCNISEQIRRVIALFDAKWSAKGIDIEFDADDVIVQGNEKMLDEVWINLLDNAIKFSDPDSTVLIEVLSKGDQVHVAFYNTGEPMSEETRKRLFEKFYQQDAAHATKGYGLGMPIVKKIVDLHHGNILVDSAEEFSTVVEVVLYKQLPSD